MNIIFFFVSAGRVRQADRDAATVINEATGKRVVFRNGTSGDESAEPCAAVAGKCIPAQYATKPRYDNAGQLVASGEAPAPAEAVEGAQAPEEVELNALGLPVGHPDNRDAIKEALEGAGVTFHPNSKTEKLVDLYREAFAASEE